MRDATDFPALLQSFFTTRLMTQRRASPHTIASYRDTFRLLLQFAQKRVRKAPSQLSLAVLNASIREQGREDSKTLFPSKRGGRLSAVGVQHMVARHAVKASATCTT